MSLPFIESILRFIFCVNVSGAFSLRPSIPNYRCLVLIRVLWGNLFGLFIAFAMFTTVVGGILMAQSTWQPGLVGLPVPESTG
jgi:hypothetical protein